MSLRRAARMHHLGVGTAHAGTRVLALADEDRITVIELNSGEVPSTHLIDPNKLSWRNQEREPGRWPSSQKCPTVFVPLGPTSFRAIRTSRRGRLARAGWRRPVLRV